MLIGAAGGRYQAVVAKTISSSRFEHDKAHQLLIGFPSHYAAIRQRVSYPSEFRSSATREQTKLPLLERASFCHVPLLCSFLDQFQCLGIKNLSPHSSQPANYNSDCSSATLNLECRREYRISPGIAHGLFTFPSSNRSRITKAERFSLLPLS
ncbi:hypothetical protein K432DRAFT_21451 [Lepidopterella palustris CBS 459.81]|uniref:Uncharacterized protein n=1 Tax=Lepidopterella palustris CBS 459.81 TaxID=1314670 RepID=A0A8E2ECL3_9PEZI|nr:hypothetical protein K432DRAFT_21451 [Lepidopterella palustris CBS 459.81]